MKQSKAYKEFKLRIQEIFNFAVLVTISVPVLKQNIKLFNEGVIKRFPDSDYFEPSVIYEVTPDTIETLKENGVETEMINELIGIRLNSSEFEEKVIKAIGEQAYKSNRNTIKRQSKNYAENILNCTTNYQSKLSKYLYFSTFSYFESFINDLAIEITESFNQIDSEKYVNNFKQDQNVLSDMTKLDKEYDPRKNDRYKKFSAKLQSQGYLNPEKIIFSSLIDLYNNKIENLKANDIPGFLEKTLFFKMTKEEIQTYHSIKNNRNSIGHGAKNFTPHLNDVINANKFFKSLSERIDKHVAFYFFKLKNFKNE